MVQFQFLSGFPVIPTWAGIQGPATSEPMGSHPQHHSWTPAFAGVTNDGGGNDEVEGCPSFSSLEEGDNRTTAKAGVTNKVSDGGGAGCEGSITNKVCVEEWDVGHRISPAKAKQKDPRNGGLRGNIAASSIYVLEILVGAARFELATSWSQTRRATAAPRPAPTPMLTPTPIRLDKRRLNKMPAFFCWMCGTPGETRTHASGSGGQCSIL